MQVNMRKLKFLIMISSTHNFILIEFHVTCGPPYVRDILVFVNNTQLTCNKIHSFKN